MKKKLLSLLLSVLVLLLAACDTLDSGENVESPPVDGTLTPESTDKTAQTGNPFLDAEVKTDRAGNGYRAYIEIGKEDALSASMEEYLEFLSQRVEDSGYNWWTVCFDDGTGLVYTGSLTYAVEYGALNSDGTMSCGYGYLMPEDDGTYSYHKYDSDASASQSNGIEITLDFSFGSRVGIYYGDFDSDGLPTGNGTFECQTAGWVFTGEWESGHWNGTGVTKWEDGTTYDGEYQDDKICGKGVYTFSDGTVISGKFADGIPSGDCTLSWPYGVSFVGVFTDFYNATGTVQSADGDSLNADIVDGELVVKD